MNEAVKTLSDEEKKPFDGVKETLNLFAEKADLAVVSSANQEAVGDEWRKNGLIAQVSYVFAQNSGTKEACLGWPAADGISAGEDTDGRGCAGGS